MAAAAIGVAGLALAGVGTAVQFVAGRKRAKAEKKQAEEQQRLQRLQARREQRRAIRESRIRRGAALNVSAQTGARESSGLAGGLSGLSSQVGAEVGFTGQTLGISENIFKFGRRAASAAQTQSLGAGITSIGGSIFGARNAFS